MNIKEMHVAIGTEMNKINSALFENILEQEVDFAINNNIQRFVKQRYGKDSNLKRKGFEMSEKRIDDLRSLVVSNYVNKAYIPVSYDPDITEKVNFYLPGDYMFAVASRFKIASNECGTFTHTTIANNINISVLDFSSFAVTNWANFRIKNGSYVLSLGTQADRYNYTEDLTYITRVILQKLRDNYNFSQYEFYWENYRDVYYPNQIIVVNKIAGVWVASLNSGVNYTITFATSTLNNTVYNNVSNSNTSGKLVQEDDVFAMQSDPFNKTIPSFPLFFASGYKYNIYIDRNIFVVTDCILSYIRAPRTVSFYLSQDCDLPEHTHSEIVSMTVNYLLEAVQAGERYKTHQEIVATNE